MLSFAGIVLIKKYSSHQDDLSNSSVHSISGGGYQYPESEDDDDLKDSRNDAMNEKLLKLSGLKACDRICHICQEVDFYHVSTSSHMCKNPAKLHLCTIHAIQLY